MNELQISAFKSFLQDNCVNPKELAEYMNTVKVGEFHFTNGVHSPVLIDGMVADGVYVSDNCYITNVEREGETTFSRAKRFCRNRGTVLPDHTARMNMLMYRDVLNNSLKLIGFAELKYGEYWADGDPAGKGEPGEIYFNGGGVGDWDYYGGWWESYKKHVRGCMMVDKSVVPQVMNVQKSTDLPPDTSFERLAAGLGVSLPYFYNFLHGDVNLPSAGNYLLKNGTCSRHTVYNQESGIFVNANLVISLRIPENALSAPQVLAYAKAFDCELPDFFELRQIAGALPEISNSLSLIGMQSFAPEADNVFESYWTKELLNKAVEEHDEKVCLHLLPVTHANKISEYYVILQDIRDKFFPK